MTYGLSNQVGISYGFAVHCNAGRGGFKKGVPVEVLEVKGYEVEGFEHKLHELGAPRIRGSWMGTGDRDTPR